MIIFFNCYEFICKNPRSNQQTLPLLKNEYQQQFSEYFCALKRFPLKQKILRTTIHIKKRSNKRNTHKYTQYTI